MIERYEDKSICTIFGVCPVCHGDMILMGEDEKGCEEWHCEKCWYAFDEKGKKGRKVYFGGGVQTRCPECGDHRVMRDPVTYIYYCKGCRTAFPNAVIEATRDRDGEIVRCKITDFGDPLYPQLCPNCGEPLRRQVIEGLNGDFEAYICRECDLAYLTGDKGELIPWPECPKCGQYSLISNGKTRKCHFCRTEFDLEGEYLNPGDKPKHGNRKTPNYNIGAIPASGPNLGDQ